MNASLNSPVRVFCCAVTLLNGVAAFAAPAQEASIILPRENSWAEQLAAREVRRYVYLRTGKLFPIIQGPERASGRGTWIVVARKDRPLLAGLPAWGAELRTLEPQGYHLKSLSRTQTLADPAPWTKRELLLIIGGDDTGTLYGAYRFAETLGARFYLHDDVLPDNQVKWKFPVLDERAKPLFAIRGIQPFHDFPEGPDWWNRGDYLAVLGQLAKLKMNFFGLHTYPEDRPNAEPTVWIGLESEIGAGGAVTKSYASSYQNSLRGNWGYSAKKTGDFAFGASELFECDGFGPEVMGTNIPAPANPDACNEVFNRTGSMLREAFTFARRVGIKTCVGTETPLIVPKAVQERLKNAGKNPSDLQTIRELYAGIFRRAAQAYPLDYYWFWTPEGWTWSGTKDEDLRATTNDLFAAIAAQQQVQAPFALATCGWVLGPQQDRALFDKVLPKNIALSCINREVGKTPVEPGFSDVHGRSKWAIPWMEDDPALTSPQLWVGRMRRDAADALRYGCDGLMGIHWRTRVLAPNVAALAQAAWNQQPWVTSYKPEPPLSKTAPTSGPVGGAHAAFPNNPIAGTADPIPYQTVRYNMSAYHLPASNGTCRVTLKFCEPHYGEAGKRVFDVKLQGQPVITNLDIFAVAGKNKALDFSFEKITITNGWLDIDFVPRVEFPSIAAIDVQGPDFSTRINCGGPAHGDYAADAPAAEPARQLYAETLDFYQDWALHEFGEPIAAEAAAIFARVDCKLPVPSVWTDGPGGIQPDPRPWPAVKRDYAFVDEFAALGPRVQGPGSLERYHYWLSTFRYFGAIGELNCAWGELNRTLEKVRAEKDEAARKNLARNLALPARRQLLRILELLYEHMLATVSTPGELGTVANWDQHNLPVLLRSEEELAKILGEPLAPELKPGRKYKGPTRVCLPTKQTALALGESLRLKVVILSEQPPRAAHLHFRRLGEGSFSRLPLQHVSRGVYTVELPWKTAEDLEYYIRVEPVGEDAVVYPPSAPQLNRTAVIYGAL
jgi:hypothetical protein